MTVTEEASEAIAETAAVLSDPDALRQIAASDDELARGEAEDAEALRSAMHGRRALRDTGEVSDDESGDKQRSAHDPGEPAQAEEPRGPGPSDQPD